LERRPELAFRESASMGATARISLKIQDTSRSAAGATAGTKEATIVIDGSACEQDRTAFNIISNAIVFQI
jgi:hypothetical protein